MPRRGQKCKCGRHTYNGKRWVLTVPDDVPAPKAPEKEHVWSCKIQSRDGYTYAVYVRAPSSEEARKRARGQLNEAQLSMGPQVLPDVDDMGTVILMFAQFDCKNQTAICLDYPHRPYCGANTDEDKVLRDMELEYLLAVLEVRERIKEKYIPLLEAVDDRTDPQSVVRLGYDEHYKAHRAEWDKVRHLYYA